jgi:hypothetical protein
VQYPAVWLLFIVGSGLAGCDSTGAINPASGKRLMSGHCHKVESNRSIKPHKLEPVCFLPIARLVAMPDEFVGKGVAVEGVLRRTPPGYPIADWELYPDRDTLEREDKSSAISIKGEIGMAGVPADPDIEYVAPVLVLGTFDGPDDEPYVGKITLLRDVWRMAPEPTLSQSVVTAPPDQAR